MALTQVTGPYPIFTDLDGTPLDDGYLYIGEINQDPEQNPIQVFWDANLTIPATQPIRTSNGYAYRNGTPALLYTGGEFSITIRNKREEFVLYSPVGYGFDPAAVSASVVKNDFTGDGVEVDFTLSSAPSTILATNVFINGVYQEKDSYTLSGNVITFSIAPPLNSSIEVMTNETGVINSGNATAISYTASFPGAVQQTVQTRLEQYISVKDFGAVGDDVADDTAAIQAAVDAAENGELYFPAGDYRITSSIAIPGRMTIRGAGVRQTLITCDDCDGFVIPAGTGFITMTDITISQAVRFTTTPNTYVGISINGSPSSQCFSHTYRNVFVDGFQEAFYAGSVGSTVFDKCAAAYSQKGLTFTGQCLNNTVIACGFGEQDSGANTPSVGSYGIKAGDNAGSIEGLMITNNLIFGVERGIWINGGIDILASNNILDMLKEFGFLMQSSASYPCINNVIDGNYIAFNFAGSDAGVYLANNLPAFDDQNRGTNVVNNEILAYSGGSATLNYGILIDGTGEDRNYLNGNRTQGCVIYDCRITQGARHRVAGNIWRSFGGSGFSTTQPVAYINNIGTVSSLAYPSPIGEFTPTIIGTSTAGTGTYTVQSGTYKIIDNVLYFNLRVNWSAHTGTGNLKVAGLPVACANDINYAPAVTVNAENITFPAGATAAIAIINTGAATIELRGSGTGLAPTPIDMDASGNINISGFYDIL
jgi:hypothetical protein